MFRSFLTIIWASCRNLIYVRKVKVSTSPNPQGGGPTLVDCPRLLIQYIRSYPPYWRPFFHQEPEDAPCLGDRDPLITYFQEMGCGYMDLIELAQDSDRWRSLVNAVMNIRVP